MIWGRQGLVGAWVVAALGCQQLQETDADDPYGTYGSGDSSTTFPASGDGADNGDDADTTGEPEIGPIDCIPGSTIDADDVNTPAHLAGIEVVHGRLKFCGLTDEKLPWLSCLREVGDLEIVESPALTTLDGLERLRRVQGRLTIEHNDALVEVDALSGLQQLDRLSVQDNASLVEFTALQSTSITGSIAIVDNPVLQTIALDAVTSLEEVSIAGGALAELSLDALETVDSLTVGGSDQLTDLDGLSAVQHVVAVHLHDLSAVQSLSGLAGLQSADAGVHIDRLDALPLVSLPALASSPRIVIEDSPAVAAIDLPNLANLTDLDLFALPALGELPALPPQPGLRRLQLQDLEQITTLDPLIVDVALIEHVRLIDLAGLGDASALAGIETLPGELRLEDLPAMPSLSSLSALQAVDGDLVVSELPALGDLQGLDALTTVGSLTIEDNVGLQTLQGLQGLTTVSGSLRIYGNAVLTDIGALWPAPNGTLQPTPGTLIEVSANTSLSQCTINDFYIALVDAGWTGGVVATIDNGPC